MTDKVKNVCIYNDRGFIKELSVPSNEEGVFMSWYDMDTDVVHHLVCKDPNCNSDHRRRGNEWRFQDEEHLWVMNALRHPNT